MGNLTQHVDLSALIIKAAMASCDAQAVVAQAGTKDLVPKLTGALAQSIQVTKASSGSLSSRVFSDCEYALYEHESLHYRHPNGQAKFMESAVINGKAKIAAAGAAAARAVLG